MSITGLEKSAFSDGLSLVEQIRAAIIREIETGALKLNQKLWSINRYSKEFGVARDTIEKAYIRLKADGYVTAIPGRGYFVTGKPGARLRVLLIFNKLSSYKKIVYDAMVEGLAGHANIDLAIHHYNPELLEDILDTHSANYHYYVVMPHFASETSVDEYMKVMEKIPQQKLILLDRALPQLKAHAAIYQDFEQDIYEALNIVKDLAAKYQEIRMVFPPDRHHPAEIVEGARQFAAENGHQFDVDDNGDEIELKQGRLFIALTEDDLALLIKKVRTSGLKIGKDIGVISFNETVYKELLDITVISTDFEEMGRKAAEIMLSNESVQLRNSFKTIIRNSL